MTSYNKSCCELVYEWVTDEGDEMQVCRWTRKNNVGGSDRIWTDRRVSDKAGKQRTKNKSISGRTSDSWRLMNKLFSWLMFFSHCGLWDTISFLSLTPTWQSEEAGVLGEKARGQHANSTQRSPSPDTNSTEGLELRRGNSTNKCTTVLPCWAVLF